MNVSKKLGICIICGKRVFSSEQYLKSDEGYCHHSCLSTKSLKA